LRTKNENLEGDPIEGLKAADEHGLEGIVSKRLDAPDGSGNRSGWTKVKTPRWQAANQRRREVIRNSFIFKMARYAD